MSNDDFSQNHYIGTKLNIKLQNNFCMLPSACVMVGGIKTKDTIYVLQHFIYIKSNLRITPDR